jgi:hypothetical protein
VPIEIVCLRVLQPGCEPNPAGVWCRFGSAFVATGVENNRDYIDVGTAINAVLPRAMTIEAWVWASAPTSPMWKTIVSRSPHFYDYATTTPNVYTDFNFQVTVAVVFRLLVSRSTSENVVAGRQYG